jgi:hypothetical protein
MAENKIELKSVSELLGMKFFIPSYQRGYRWTEQQVKDLLEDIWEFSKKKKQEYEFYCLQPLVVKCMNNNDKQKAQLNINEEWYEVIDGQQRLTTMFLILSSLKETISILGLPTDLYELKYQRESKDFNVTSFLNNISASNAINDSYIDLFYMSSAFKIIDSWLKSNKVNKGDFCNALLKLDIDDNQDNTRDKANNVRFIWYESVDEDPIKVFTRLNIGKISLTNAELIKALFLNRSNFGEKESEHLKLRQQEIASEWDNIEYTLQNDEFWLFLHEKGYDRPTRIDFIFDLICEQNSLNLREELYKSIGNDDYKTFRYFYEYIRTDSSNIEDCWKEVKKYFQTFKEWFDDLELYHYVGYLRCPLKKKEKVIDIKELYDKWIGTKDIFVKFLREKIKERIKDCNDLAKQYEVDGGPAKTTCRSLLLLHNIQTVVNQNNKLSSKEEYKLPVFYKFPFHLFKNENWDVEHIDSNTTNGLENEKDQKEWLKYSVLGANPSEELKKEIMDFLRNDNGKKTFEDLCQEIEKDNQSESWHNPEQDKNKVWNFVLLDAGTNRGYGNALFPAKRRCIIGKDQGKTYLIDNETLEVSSQDGAIAFIPPVTKNVFLKYYNTSIENLREWSESDAEAYKGNILKTLSVFGVEDSTNINNTERNEL